MLGTPRSRGLTTVAWQSVSAKLTLQMHKPHKAHKNNHSSKQKQNNPKYKVQSNYTVQKIEKKYENINPSLKLNLSSNALPDAAGLHHGYFSPNMIRQGIPR